MEPFLRGVFGQGSQGKLPYDPALRQDLFSIWASITSKDIEQTRLSLSSSPVSDGITLSSLRETPLPIFVRIFSLILWCWRLCQDQWISRIILIPKKDGAEEPGVFRPITISSVISRQIHILSSPKRLSTL